MRAARGLAAALLVLAALALAAAWFVPPLLDWNGYRDEIAARASRMLGQRVTIAGPVRLALLPHAALTAEQVTLGGTLSVAALRLEAAPAPLLAGRIEPTALVLQSPRLLLPWPPPEGFFAAPPRWPPGLAVRIEDGTVVFGSFAATRLAVQARVGETGALAVDGRGLLGGQDWSFAARLTAFGPDGSSGVDVRLDGGGRLAGTSLRFNGQIAGMNSLGGTATVAGGDLSALLPAPPVAFRAQGRLTAADGLVAADDLAIELADQPARAAVALRLLPIQRLDVSLAIGRLDLAAWLRPLLHPPPGEDFGLPVGLDVSAEAAALAGGTLRRLRCAFDLSPGAAELREASVILPGAATLNLSGRISRGAAAGFFGAGQIELPDVPATAGWAAAAIGLDAGVPARLPRTAAFAGQVTASAAQVALTQLVGRLEGGAASGDLLLRPGSRPALGVTARLARLDLDAWAPGGVPAWSALPALGGGADVSLDLQVAQAALRGLALDELAIRAEATPGGLAVQRLSARLAGARVQASGAIDAGGALADGKLDLAAAPAADLAPAVAAWAGAVGMAALLPRLGALHLAATAAGPPGAIAGHVTLDAAGGGVVADAVVDMAAGAARATVSVTHPSAADLLARLGWLPAGAAGWLGTGPLTLRADLSAKSELLAAERLELSAGALQGEAALTADWQGALPRLTGRIAAGTLPLPWPAGMGAAPLPFGLLKNWEAALEVRADRLLVGLQPVAAAVQARLGVAEGVLGVAGLSARLGSGEISASAAIDGAATPPTVQADASLRGAVITGPLGLGALDVDAGTASGRVRLAASGYSFPALAATLQGSATLEVADGRLLGVDLGGLRTALLDAVGATGPALEAALIPSLSGGATDFTTLQAEGDLSSGGLALRLARLAGPSGDVTASGVIGLEGIDVQLGLRPTLPGDPAAGPEVGLRLTGPATAPVRTPEFSDVLRWLGHG